MTTEVSKLIWSDIKSTVTGVPLLGRSYPNLGLAVVIFVAVALVLGVSGIGSNNAPAGFVDAQSQGICDRTPAVRDAILVTLAPETLCKDVSETVLNGITGSVAIFDPSLESLHPDDFKGLTAITTLSIFATALESLPADIFSDLQSVTRLGLTDNRLTTVEANAFEGLIGMTDLSLSSNPRLESISPDAFEGLSALKTLNLSGTRISTLPSGVFDGLSSVETLTISNTPLVNLPQGVFDPLTALSWLSLRANSELVSLPPRTFVDNTNLERLTLDTNPKLASLPEVMFSGGHTLRIVDIRATAIESLPQNFIAAMTAIESLLLPSTLTEWPDGFVLPDNLYRLVIRGNEAFQTLPDDVLITPLPQSLRWLQVFDIQLSEATLTAIGTHQPTHENLWFNVLFENTGITGADITDLINNWCNNDPACPVWNGPERFSVKNEDLSDWLDPDSDPTTLEEHRAAVRNLALQGGYGGQLFLDDTRMSAAQVTELLTHIPKGMMDTISLVNLDLDGLEIGPSTFTFADFTFLFELDLADSGIGDATAKKIIDDLPNFYFEIFSLAGNNVRTVPVFPVNGLYNLYLNRNPLETVTSGAFDNLARLELLDLGFGELESIPAGIFDNNLELRTVRLNNNMLSELPAGLFDNNPKLYRVYLEYNMLSELPVGLFDNNPTLHDLILNDNQLTDLPADLLHKIVEEHAVSGLWVIDLSNNRFTELPDGFFDGREQLRELYLSNNRLTNPPDFTDSIRLEVLNLQGNEFERMLTDFPYLKRLQTFNGVETDDADETEETEEGEQEPKLLPTSDARILRIEPTISSVTVSPGDEVRLAVDIYGAQDILDNSLGDGIAFDWGDGDAGGDFDGEGRDVAFTAPERPGTFTVTVAAPSESCRAPLTDEVRCAATFEIKVRRSSAAVEPTPAPSNPAGAIPTILTDPDGNQYEVFTPEGGGTFTGDDSSLSAGPGVVPNGEIVGLRISEGGSASNAGKTYQRYSLGGNWYEISAVDASNTSVSSYGLSDAVEVCIPLPDALRSNISSLALVVINADDSLTILSSIVRISSSGTNVCGSLSSVPAKLAVGTSGSPAALPTAVPETDESDLPDTGGAAPSNDGMIWALILGLAIVVFGYAVLRAARRRTNQMR